MTFRDCEITLSVFFFLFPHFLGLGLDISFGAGPEEVGKHPGQKPPKCPLANSTHLFSLTILRSPFAAFIGHSCWPMAILIALPGDFQN